jgi:16S rRNA (cytosine967-C5)-methyltransferase
MIAPARVAALECLLALSSGGSDLGTELERARGQLADPRDRALTTDIVSGVQRWRAALDHLINGFAERPIDRLDPEVLEVLRLSAYQLLRLTRVPASAVVDDAVNLVGRSGKKSARGFVNAVLRSLSRRRGALPLPAKPSNVADREAMLAYLATTLSHPRWLVERWLDRFGFDATEQWLTYNNTSPGLTIRANTLRTTVEALQTQLASQGIPAERGRFGPDCLHLPRGDRGQLAALDRLPGLFIVQDEASQLIPLLAGPDPGRRVLDACASPGGKSTALAAAQLAVRSRVHDDTHGVDRHPCLVACDLRERRVNLLRRALESAGAEHVQVVQADLLQPLPFAPVFECVVVDAPCSGLGTLRRDPDIKWRRQPSDLPVLARAQQTMLANAAAVVAPAGRLVYATCSSEPDENEDVVAAFTERHGFVHVDARGAHSALDPMLFDADGALHTSPLRHGLDAFFGVVLRRRP